MKSLHVLLLVVFSTTLFHFGSATHALTCQNDVIFVQDVGEIIFNDPEYPYGRNIPKYDGSSAPFIIPGPTVAVTCKNEDVYVTQMDGGVSNPAGRNGRVLLQANTGTSIYVHIVTCKDNEIYAANLTSSKLQIGISLEGPRNVIGCENNVHYIHDKYSGRREAKIGVRSSSSPKPCNIIRGVSADQVVTEVEGHTMNKLHCVNVGNTAKAIMIGSERFESLSCDNYGWKGKTIGERKDLVEIIDDNFVLTMSCVDYSDNDPTKVTSLLPPVTTEVPTIPPTIPSTTEVPTTTTTKAVEQTTPYPIDYDRAHQLISCKQDIIFVQDPSGLQVSSPVKSVYLGGKVAVTCKNDIIYVVQPCGSTRTIPSGNANGEAVKVLLHSNTNEELTSIHIITCKDNEMYAANLTSDELQIHEKFDFDNLTIWCENNVHYIKDERTGKIVGENRGRREAKIGMRSGAFEVTGDLSNEGRRK